MKGVTAFGRDTFHQISSLFYTCLLIDQVKFLHVSTLGNVPRSAACLSGQLSITKLSHSFKVSGRRRNAEIGPGSFGIVVCRFVGTVPDILGLVALGPNPA